MTNASSNPGQVKFVDIEKMIHYKDEFIPLSQCCESTKFTKYILDEQHQEICLWCLFPEILVVFFYYIHHKSVLEHPLLSKPKLLKFLTLPQGLASTIKGTEPENFKNKESEVSTSVPLGTTFI